MTSGPRLIGACAVFALAIGCARVAPPPPPPAETKPALPAIVLKELPAFPLKAHIESADIVGGAYTVAKLVDAGGDLFHTPFNGLDGVGSFVREDGSKVARFAPLGPRGPTAQACGECHAEPFPTSAGLAHSAVARAKKGTLTPLNVRSVTSVFGNGILQLLAQEMTEDLWTARDEAMTAAKATPGTRVARPLASKGTSFGEIGATAAATGEVKVDTSKVVGLDPDLVVRPLGWKGDVPTLRNFSVGAAAGAMGLVADELVWKKAGAGKSPDVDGDGVGRELSVGDVTAMTVYMAAQETPVDAGTLATLGYVQALSPDDAGRVEAGRKVFDALGCATCHTPEMPLLNTRFEEPTLRGRGQYLRRRPCEARPGVRPQAAVRVRHSPGRAATQGRGSRRRRGHHQALRRSQAARDGPAACRSCGHKRVDWRGPRNRQTRGPARRDSGRSLSDGRTLGCRQHGAVAPRQPRGDVARSRPVAWRGCPAGGGGPWAQRGASVAGRVREGVGG